MYYRLHYTANKMDEEAQEIEGTKGYILSLCSAIGGLEEIKQDDGTVGQIYCAGDEALGTKESKIMMLVLTPHK